MYTKLNTILNTIAIAHVYEILSGNILLHSVMMVVFLFFVFFKLSLRIDTVIQ